MKSGKVDNYNADNRYIHIYIYIYLLYVCRIVYLEMCSFSPIIFFTFHSTLCLQCLHVISHQADAMKEAKF